MTVLVQELPSQWRVNQDVGGGLRSGFGKSGLQLRRGPNQLTKRLHLTVFPA